MTGPQDPSSASDPAEDPFAELRSPTIPPLRGGVSTHEQILRRVSRRRTRSAAALAVAVVATLAVLVGVPLWVTGRPGGPPPVANQPSTPSTLGAAGPVPSGFAPRSLTFASAQFGYALGAASSSSKPCTTVAVTTDGGRTWSRASSAPGTGDVAGRGGVDQLRYTPAGNGWAFGGELWSSHAGASFVQVPLPATQAAIGLEPAGARVLAVLADCSDGECTRSRITGSPAGSDEFTPLPGMSTMAGRAQISVSGTTVWAVSTGGGATTVVRGPTDGVGALTTRPSPCPASTSDAGVVAGPREVVITCAATNGAVSVHVSTDDATSWTETAANAPAIPDSPALLESGILLLRGNQGSVLRSTDDGASWTRRSIG